MSVAAILASLTAGIALGMFFFGGLWWTVRGLSSTAHPALLALGSFGLRTLVVLAGFLLLAKQNAGHAILAAVSFMAGRLIVSRFFARLYPTAPRPPEAKCT